MSKTPESWGLGKRTERVCRVAYTLNNEQPVRCSIIGDQPLFFMDFEGALEEELRPVADEFGIDAIESGLLGLQEKIKALDGLASYADRPTAQIIEQFQDDARFMTGPYIPSDIKPGAQDITKIFRKSRLAAAFMDFAAGYGTKLRDDVAAGTAVYDRRNGSIAVNPELDLADRVLLAARELRRAWQHRNGALVHPLTFHPDQAILIARAQAADLAAAMVRVAWELQLAGEKDAWERLERSSMSDLARAFAREAYMDFRTLNNGVAASAAFETWFLSERCRHEDRRLIQQMLADYQGYVFDGEAAPQNVTADLITALGTAPFGKNYLAPYIRTIMGDPVFTDVRDRANANFLWFIKFERSFRETEQGMKRAEAAGGQRRTGEVVSLFRDTDGRAGKEKIPTPKGFS